MENARAEKLVIVFGDSPDKLRRLPCH
jgi:hypothetical protein